MAEIEALETDKKVYDVEDIQRLLGIGRSKAYTYLDEVYRKQEPFRVIKIGKLFRVPKQSFDNWLDRITYEGGTVGKRHSAEKQVIF